MTYFDELTKAMTWLGEKEDTIFIGQSVAYPGNTLFKTLSGVPIEKRLELPVAEEMQMGMSIGLSLCNKTVISIYPRFDFLLLAVNQLVNHLDKNLYPLKGKVIIRVGIGATKPLYPGVQHCGDYTEAFRRLLKNVLIIKLDYTEEIFHSYEMAYILNQSSLIVEDMNLYGME